MCIRDSFGTLVERLGPIGSLAAESQALVRTHCYALTNEFSEAAVASAMHPAPSSPAPGRRAFDAWAVDAGCAVSAEEHGDGRWLLGVHAADLAHIVRAGSPLDREARRRGATAHLVPHRYALLPRELEEAVAFDRSSEVHALSVVFTAEGERIADVWIGHSTVRTRETPRPAAVPDAVRRAVEAMRARRMAHGAIDMHTTRLSFTLERDRPVAVHAVDDRVSELDAVVAELRVQAHMAVAQRIAVAFPDAALLQRQLPPNERAMQVLGEQLAALRRDASPAEPLTPATLPAVLAAVPPAARAAADALVRKVLEVPRWFATGMVDVSKMGHYTHAAPLYTEFTAPLQRYADICVQRQLCAALANDTPSRADTESIAKTAQQCTVREAAAARAAAQSAHLYLCQLLRDEAPLVRRRAIVMSIAPHSFDVLVPSLAVEKRVHLDCLPLDASHWDAVTRTLTLTWRPGMDSLAWLAQGLDDAHCAALWDRVRPSPASVLMPPAPGAASQHIAPGTELDIVCVADTDKSPPILKLLVCNPCA